MLFVYLFVLVVRGVIPLFPSGISYLGVASNDYSFAIPKSADGGDSRAPTSLLHSFFPLGDFFVIPKSADGILAILSRSPSLKQAWTRSLGKVLRREGDSNPRNPFGVYTLSRRASSTTRASLLRRNWLARRNSHASLACRRCSS